MGKLILVPTPIGNLEDITLRALHVLRDCDILYAEDTRVTKKLLNHFEIHKMVKSFHAHNEHRLLDRYIEEIKNNTACALVSDAGTPGISDPGFLLVRACLKEQIEVECLPGPTALIPALVASGFPCDTFVFEGFLPHKKGRQTTLQRIEKETRTVLFYESPHRLLKCLEQMEIIFGEDRRICVVREISKKFETYHRGNVKEMKEYFQNNDPKGEIVLVVEGKK